MTAVHKFTDRDVRERPELVAEAIRYLRWYQGDFEFLIDAKRFEETNGHLPQPTARAVLNCMRMDARYALVLGGDVPEPSWYEPTPPPPPVPRRLRVVEEPKEVRHPHDLKVVWKKRYGISPGVGRGSGARVWHHLDTERSTIRYYPAVDEYQPRLRWLCGQRSTYVLDDDAPQNPLLDECRSCRRVLCERSLAQPTSKENLDA